MAPADRPTRCSKCEAENPGGKKFCGKCGARLGGRCPKCGAENPPDDTFCGDCGAALGGSASPKESDTPPVRVTETAEPEKLEGERKTVTALFADIKGSTELEQDLDPEEARAIVDPALELMMEAVRRYDGYIVQSTGDGIFALFGAPVANEDHPQRALFAALRMQEELRRYSAKLRETGNLPLEARVGVNSGEVVVRSITTGPGHTEYTPIGHTANLASRMQALAPTGSIAISEQTRRLVEGYFELKPLGPTKVKGVSEPVNVYEVTGPGALRTHFQLSARRGLTRFVGRDAELAQLSRAFELASSGHGQIAAIVADAGTGKSRLVYEFKATIAAECKLFEAYSVSHGNAAPWLPVLELLRAYFRLQQVDDAPTRREKVRSALAALDIELGDAPRYLWNLLAIQEEPDPLAQMDALIKRQRTLEAIKRIILRESLNQPVVIVFEDLHWIDVETQALLDLLADTIANARVLMLVNYRREYRHEWGNKSYYSQLRLAALDSGAASQMLTTLLGDNAELDSLKRSIIERTEGNPFFIEEMLQVLFDEGALARNGLVKVTRPLAQVRLPPTVQGIIASRIDRQPPEYKQLLQTLAVIGREARLDLIRQVVPIAEPRLQRMLAELQASEFIYEQPAFPDAEYIFKHALTQEVAYNSLLIERRKPFHEQTARAIETLFASNLVDHYGELAHHYGLSGNADKALDYLRLSGEQAVKRSANAEATIYFESALELLRSRPDTPERAVCELTLQVALAVALEASKGWSAPEVERTCSRALQLCQQVGESPQIFPALFGLHAFYANRAKLRRALELAEQGLKLAEHLQDSGLMLQARHMLAYNLAYLGELAAAREHAQQGIALYDPKYHALAFSISGDDPGVCCFCFQALALWGLGYPDQAFKSVSDAISLAKKLSHPLSLALALTIGAMVHQLRRDRAAVQQQAEACITLCTDQGFPYFLALGKIMHGWALAHQGKADGILEMREGLSAYRATGADSFRPYHLALIAEGCSALGDQHEALRAVSEALEWMECADERFYEPEVYRLKGTLVLRSEETSGQSRLRLPTHSAKAEIEAERCFRKAIDAARRQAAKSHELRAAMDLCRLSGEGGDRGEARAMLADVYNWFTEGFETADLKDAKALLDELNA